MFTLYTWSVYLLWKPPKIDRGENIGHGVFKVSK